MNKKLLLVIVTITVLACNTVLPPPPTRTPRPTRVPPTETPLPPTEALPEPTEIPATPVPSTELTIVRLHPEDGELAVLLPEHAKIAVSQGQMPVVEFDATWCPPCRAIETALDAENELMLQAYAGVYLIKLDVDEWGWGDSDLHDFEFDGIPIYFKLDAEGQQTGEQIDANAWDENIPENIAPVMDDFFHGD